MMDHVNIARVFDGGATEAGRPYFVMELVHGVPITKYCDDNHLTPRERLELFVPVCQAIQHAHQKGIIHRDIKPSNVMVTLYDGKPVPKVIDFGVAKATEQKLTERTLFTQYGTMVGTLEYMSPEQAEMSALGVDTRSDIYSLGVLLYELLTGSTPLTHKRMKEAAYAEILRMIKEEEPPKPSTRLSDSGEALASISANRHTEPAKLTKLVRGELDWIVMKTPGEGPQPPLRDGQRLRHGRAALPGRRAGAGVSAVGAVYRLRKFVRRNRGPVLAATLVLLALVAGIVGTTLGLVDARRGRDAAVQAEKGEARQRQIAQDNAQKALDAATAEEKAKVTAETSDAETRAVLGFVEGKIFAAMRPEFNGGLGDKVTLRRAIEDALQFVESSFKEQPLIEARLRMTIGQSFNYMGEYERAAEQFQASRRLYAAHRDPAHTDTAVATSNLASAYRFLHRHAEAAVLCEEQLAVQKAMLGLKDRQTLFTMRSLAGDYYQLGRHAEALKLREETLELQKAAFGPDDYDTLRTMSDLVMHHALADRHAEVLKLRQEMVALLERKLLLQKAQLGSDHSKTLATMNALATIYAELRRHPELMKLLEERLPLEKVRYGPDDRRTLETMRKLATEYFNAGRRDDFLKLREETLALEKVKYGPDDRRTLDSMTRLAKNYVAAGRDAEALQLREERLALLERKLVLQEAKLGFDHPETLAIMSDLASAYADLGRHAEALKLREQRLARLEQRLARLEQRLARQKAKLGSDDPETLASMNALATCYADLGRHAESFKLREELLALDKVKYGADDDRTLARMLLLANSYVAAGHQAEAVRLREELLAARTKRFGRDDRTTLGVMGDLADAYWYVRRPADGVKLMEEKLAIQTAKFGPDYTDTLGTAYKLATSYVRVGRYADAVKLHEETLALRQAKHGPDHRDTLASMWSLAFALVKFKRGAEALPLIDECLKHAGRNVIDPTMIPQVMFFRLRHFQQTRDAAGCRTTAAMWEKLNRTDANSLYQAAACRAVTAAVIRGADGKSPQEEKDAVAEADRAMVWLKQAVAAGYNNAALMKRDPDLNALRDRDDFKKLVAELEARKGGAKKQDVPNKAAEKPVKPNDK